MRASPHGRPDTEQVRWTPINEWEALMRCPPGTEPEPDRPLTPLEQQLLAVMEELTEFDRLVFCGYYLERLSLRKLGRELGISKTTVARERDRIRQQLAERLA
jgi:RNA polymerase sigma factor (sigma-70 family)